MSTTQITNPADIICGLKAAATALECYYQMDMLKQTQELKQKKTTPPMFMMIPIEDKDIVTSKKKLTTCRTNACLEEIQDSKEGFSVINTRFKEKDTCHNLSPDLKFPEMRNGVLFSRCYCVHRDGLQDSCPLSQCQGQPECLFKPWPICPPGKYLRCRYPKQYPAE